MDSDSRYRAKGVFVGAAFIVVGLAITLTEGPRWYAGKRTHDWQAVAATVTESRQAPARYTGSDGRTVTVPELQFRYRYEVGGQAYESNRITIDGKEIAVRDQAAFIRAHPAGSAVRIYVDPGRPGDAVLERGAPESSIVVALLPLMFVVAGPLLIWGSLSGRIDRFLARRGWRYR